MKKYMLALLAVFVLAIACGSATTPDQVVSNLFDAVKNADGDAIISCLSAETIVGIDEMLTEIKADPEGTVAMAVMFDVEITPEEVSDLTAGKALTLILGSEIAQTQMPDMSNIEIGEATIDGETATVPVTMDGDTKEITLILEDGNWKIDGNDFNM